MRRRLVDDEEEKPSGFKFEWFGNNRFICDVLDDMRKCNTSLNFSPMAGLIEEAQVMANRMESALGDQKGLIKLNKEYAKARNAYDALQLEYKELEKKVKSMRSTKKTKS